MLAAGRGLRGGQLSDMITKGSPAGWTVTADIAAHKDQTSAQTDRIGIGYTPPASGRMMRLNGEPLKSFEKLTTLIPQIWLTPSMDRLFTDAAAGRRKFLDRFAQTLDPALVTHNSQFERAMRERNKILQTHNLRDAASWLASLEDVMAVQATAIAASRLQALDSLATGLSHMPDTPFPAADIAVEGMLESWLRDKSALEVEDLYRAKLHNMRGADAQAGRCLEGPHRSDFLVFHVEKNMLAAQCSTGEQKALLIGLVLAQARSAYHRTGTVPLLLLDEVAAHLDETRRTALAENLYRLGGQSWITGTDMAYFACFGDAADVLQVENGQVSISKSW